MLGPVTPVTSHPVQPQVRLQHSLESISLEIIVILKMPAQQLLGLRSLILILGRNVSSRVAKLANYTWHYPQKRLGTWAQPNHNWSQGQIGCHQSFPWCYKELFTLHY